MSDPVPSAANSSGSSLSSSSDSVDKRVIKKAGGRHLVYRINRGRWWFLPKPYALISNIEGSILVFYGAGQIWATHKKLRRINEWMVRIPRFISKRIVKIVDDLQQNISDFIEQIDEPGVIGTLVVERKVIEFHWTVPRGQRNDEKDAELRIMIDREFDKLAKCFARLQLVGQEGQHDVQEDEVSLHGSQT